MKNSSQKITLVGLLALIVALGGGFLYGRYRQSNVKILPVFVPSGQPRSEFYTITSEELGNEKIITNVEEAVSVRAPLAWEEHAYLEKINQSKILAVSYAKREESDEVESSRVDLIVSKKANPQNLSLERWFQLRRQQFLETEFYYKTHPLEYQSSKIYLNSNLAYTIIKDAFSTKFYYLKASDSATIYEISCDVKADGKFKKYYEEYFSDCLSILQTSLKLP